MGIDVVSLEMRGNGQSDWTMGTIQNDAAGDYYTFAGDFALPLSFRATALDGTVTTLDDAINSFDGGESATMAVSGNDPFTMGDGPNDGSVATVDFIGMLSVL